MLVGKFTDGHGTDSVDIMEFIGSKNTGGRKEKCSIIRYALIIKDLQF